MKEAEFEALIAANPDKTITSRKIKVKIGDYETMRVGVEAVEKRLEGDLSATKREALEEERDGLVEAMQEMDQALCADVQNYFDNYEKYQENSRRLAAGREKAKLQKSAPPAGQPPAQTAELTIDEDKLRDQQQQSQEATATDVAPIAQNTAVVAGSEPAEQGQEEGEKKKGGWLSTLLFVGLAIVTFGAVKANMDSKY